jgi:hypothetical protein
MIPLRDENEVKNFKRKIIKDNLDNPNLDFVITSCTIKGTIYDHRMIKDSIWDYNELQILIEK